MKTEECGTLIWPFKKMVASCQVGENIQSGKPVLIIGVGCKPMTED